MINEELNRLISLAQGDRTQNEFALHCGINSAALTRIMRGEYEPSPNTLKKIADKAYNGVTYQQLLLAAGIVEKSDLSYLNIPDNLQEARIAFYGGVEGLKQEDIDKVAEYIEFLKSKGQ